MSIRNVKNKRYEKEKIMAQKATVRKIITIAKNKFYLEIYMGLETIGWEIFPDTYNAALYAFSNKDKLNKLIEKKYLYEPEK